MPSDGTRRSRRDRRSHRSENPDTQGSGYSHQDPRNIQHEDYSRFSTNPNDYYARSEPYAARSGDQYDCGRDASRDDDGELSQSDTTRRSSEWAMIPYQDPTIRASPSVASDSTLVLEAPELNPRPTSSRRRRYRSRSRSCSRDRYYVDYDAEIMSGLSHPFPAGRSYSSSPDHQHSYRTNNSNRQSSRGHSYAPSTRNRQREEDHSCVVDHYSYEREDRSEMPYHTIHVMDDEYSYRPDEEQQGSSSSTAQVIILPAPLIESVKHERPSREYPGGRSFYNLKPVMRR